MKYEYSKYQIKKLQEDREALLEALKQSNELLFKLILKLRINDYRHKLIMDRRVQNEQAIAKAEGKP